jgi:glycolate oxidase subunit GlcD
VQILHESKVPFAARGAGTGLSGGALVPPGGVVLALTRLNKVLEVHPEESWALVEPGVINASLSRSVKKYGLQFAPDPASQRVCTVGGNAAENSGGPHCFLHGMTTQHVLFVEVILPNGDIETWGTQNSADDALDLRGFFLGSEGSVAIASKLGLRLVPLPLGTRTWLAAYSSMNDACDTVSEIVAEGLQPAAMEVMDQQAIHAVEDSVYRCGLPKNAAAVLLLELEGHPGVLERDAVSIERTLKKRGPISFEEALSALEQAALWKGRKGAGGALGRLAPDSYVMDGVVPRSKLAEIMAFVQSVQSETGLPVANLFHAGDGNIHPHFSYDARCPKQAKIVEEAGAKILKRCLKLGGSLTGEHGIGLEKEALLDLQFDKSTLSFMERMRGVFNPNDQLNPGKGLPLGKACAEAFHRHRGGGESQ